MWIDIGFLAFLGFGFYIGWKRGIIKTFYAILSIIIAILLSFKLSPFLINILDNSLKLGSTISFILGFIIVFIAVVFVVRLIGKMFEKVLKAIKLNFMNKLAGGIIMSLGMVFMFSGILWFLDQTKVLAPRQKEQSVSYPRLAPLPEAMRGTFDQLRPAFKGYWDKSREAMQDSNTSEEATTNENIEK